MSALHHPITEQELAPNSRLLGIACYGANGHQIHRSPHLSGSARLIGSCGIRVEGLPGLRYPDLDALLADPDVDLVSLCSPRRDAQAADAIRCLEAGKHVLAEKPCALTEAELDAVLACAARTGRRFREMAGSERLPHYAALHRLVREGRIGAPFQVVVQKSYPWYADRPQDEGIDGGLLLQVGIHAVRLAEAMADSPITGITCERTGFGNPGTGDLHMAAGLIIRHASGCLSLAAANYGNTTTSGAWGNDTVRVFGPGGFLASEMDGRTVTMALAQQPPVDVAPATETPFHLQLYLRELQGLPTDLPAPVDELRSLRHLLRAHAALRRRNP